MFKKLINFLKVNKCSKTIEMIMKITVFNLKGGQGKTTLSLSLALLYDFLIVTNDEYSPIDKVLPQGYVKHIKQGEQLPKIPDEVNVIYDFGGYPDLRVIEASKNSDWIIVPIIYKSPLDMQTAIKTVGELEKYNHKIILVINQAQKGDFEKAKKVLNEFFDYPLFEVKNSTVFVKMVETSQSIQELVDESPLFCYHYKKPLEQIKSIKKFIS
jgi:cellulose biosynthesis protein BcsQ